MARATKTKSKRKSAPAKRGVKRASPGKRRAKAAKPRKKKSALDRLISSLPLVS